MSYEGASHTVPSPTRGEGTMGRCSAQQQDSIRVRVRNSQLAQRIELRHIAGGIDAHADHGGALGLDCGAERIAQALLGVDHDAVSTKGMRELLPVDAA